MPVCNITGTLRDPKGTILANTAVMFRRESSTVKAQDSAVIIPLEASATSDQQGLIAVALYPGRYVAEANAGDRTVKFVVGVPDSANADLAELIDQHPPVTVSVLAQAQAAR